ncbi:high affinity immunoglobulin epsilon receptor subunit beta-like [Gracilinanus agilis]|uniref:high affinity immunoglobulin epsilon receptor subunit beta-like n=1 Tax=Gracilinanus agilis TaxID=191870 RepID=UPI001CFD8A15|nr:high affinity immunoglobulin epsilon receptor subunit beta-like [Gracilinanus agilis]
MISEVPESIIVSPNDDDINPGKAEIVNSPSRIKDELRTFLKNLLQLLGAFQILIGLINTSLWISWSSWLPIGTYGKWNLGVLISGYGLWGGLSFTISGIFSLVSAKISSKALVKCCLVMNILSSLAALSGIIIIYIYMIGNYDCQNSNQILTCFKDIVIIKGFVLGKLTLAAMEFSISSFIVAFSAFQIKVPEDKSTEPENPYEDLLFQPDPYEEINSQQEGYEQYDP